MIIERVKYIIWAKDTPRAIAFYRDTLGGRVIRQTEHIAEIVAAGGTLRNDPQPENGEPPHLAMCSDPEGNQIMLTRKRG